MPCSDIFWKLLRDVTSQATIKCKQLFSCAVKKEPDHDTTLHAFVTSAFNYGKCVAFERSVGWPVTSLLP